MDTTINLSNPQTSEEIRYSSLECWWIRVGWSNEDTTILGTDIPDKCGDSYPNEWCWVKCIFIYSIDNELNKLSRNY